MQWSALRCWGRCRLRQRRRSPWSLSRAPEPAAEEKPAPARPKLVVNNDNELFKTLAQLLAAAPGERINVEDVYTAYATRCQAEGEEPSTPAQFPLKKFCDANGIKTRKTKGQVYLVDVRVVPSKSPVVGGSS